MKGVSETVSYTIISSVVIILSLIVFYMAVSMSDETRYILEYGQIKSIMKDIAIVRFTDILRGSRVKYYFTSSSIGIGYKKLNTSFSISISGNSYNIVYTIDDFYSIYAGGNKILISGKSIIYGEQNKYIINNINQAPLLIEYNENTGTYIELIVDKIFYTIFNITGANENIIVVKLVIPRIVKPIMYGKNIIYIYSGINDEKTITFNNVTEFIIYLNGNRIIDSQEMFRNSGLNPASINSFQLDIIVYDIYFEIY